MKKVFIVSILLVAMLFSGIALVQAKSEQQNPASDIERGVFVHYPHAQGQAKGAATGDRVNDFKYSGIHWTGIRPSVPYSVNWSNKNGLSQKDVLSAVQSAFIEWESHNPADSNYIRFDYRELTNLETSANPSRDYTNTVSFEPLNSAYPNAIAVTFYWYSRGTKALLETDTVFNSDLAWAVNNDPNSYDLQNIATHEFGHWLLLGDLYSLRDRALTMFGYGGLGETDKSTLGRGDITGINRIY